MPIDKTKAKHFKSFKEAEEYEIEGMNKLSYQERLSILLTLRKEFYNVSGKLESRLQRFHKFSKRKRS